MIPTSNESEPLSFRISKVESREFLKRIAVARAASYSSRHPILAATLVLPEAEDLDRNSGVFAAIDKADNLSILGSIRIDSPDNTKTKLNNIGIKLPLPHSAFASRFHICHPVNSTIVKLALFKTVHRYCLFRQIRYILVAAQPPLDRLYAGLGFTSFPNVAQPISIPWAEDTLTHLMFLDTLDIIHNWKKSNHNLYDFMAAYYHPDIDFFSVGSNEIL
jgi:hypothetical protein